MSETFKDLFSGQANAYARFRPHYPKEIYAYLSGLCTAHELAWDCGTGNGQAASMLTGYFKKVIATDPSAEQLKNASENAKIEYLVLRAGDSLPTPAESVDLVTAAQAAHWFNHERFYAEVKRALKKNGVIALWCYGRHRDISAEIDPLLNKFYFDIVGPYWDPEVKYVQEKYQTLPFPFDEITPQNFTMSMPWDLEALMGYLWSWSSTQKYLKQNKENPLHEIEDDLRRAWGDPKSLRKISWDLYFRIGRNT